MGFAEQSKRMENNDWAVENLQTIRTLMERSALYRRALAPIMLLAGVVGILAAVIGMKLHLNTAKTFTDYWLCMAVLVIAGAFYITRRQALKDNELLWSPPTKRVAQALVPPFASGMVLGIIFGPGSVARLIDFVVLLPFLWAFIYGCALHAAGFFMPRGVRWFGWLFIVSASIGLFYVMLVRPNFDVNGHWLMGIYFGGLHLAYGGYLYLTEKKHPAP
jgi:hypothetical protein